MALLPELSSFLLGGMMVSLLLPPLVIPLAIVFCYFRARRNYGLKEYHFSLFCDCIFDEPNLGAQASLIISEGFALCQTRSA